MAARNFVVRQIENLKTEAQWLADESYQILPNEAVVAIVPKTVTVDGVEKTVNYIRTKVNTSTSSRLFKELDYSDEYINIKIEGDLAQLGSDFTDEITALKDRLSSDEATINTHTTDLQNLSDVADAHDARITTNADNIKANADEIDDIKSRLDSDEATINQHTTDIQNLSDIADSHDNSITTINNSITEINTNIEAIKDDFDDKIANIDFSEMEAGIAKNADDISDLQSRLDSDETTINQHTTDIQNLSDAVDAHGNSLTEINTKITEINTTITNLDNTEIVGIKGRLDGVEESVNQHTTDIQNLSEALGNIKPASVLSTNKPDANTLAVGGIWFHNLG